MHVEDEFHNFSMVFTLGDILKIRIITDIILCFWSKQMPDIGRNATSAKEVLEERPSLSQTAMLVRRRLVFSYTVCRSVIQLYHNHNAMK